MFLFSFNLKSGLGQKGNIDYRKFFGSAFLLSFLGEIVKYTHNMRLAQPSPIKMLKQHRDLNAKHYVARQWAG